MVHFTKNRIKPFDWSRLAQYGKWIWLHAKFQILVGHKYSCPSELSPGSFSPVLRFPVAVPLLVPFPRPGPILLTLGAKALKLHVLRNTCSVGNTFLIVCSMGQDDVLVPRLHRVTLPHHFRE